MRLRPALAAALLAGAGLAGSASAWTTGHPADYGRVVLIRRAAAARMDAVGFDHWRHRARFTCRLCHVDVGFAMTAGDTGVTGETNRAGFHCGACHDGKRQVAGRTVFAACGERPAEGPPPAACRRCHGQGDAAARHKEFETFAAGLPRRGLDDSIDWEAAELKGLVIPADQVEGISFPRAPLKMDKDVTLASKAWMADVRFSHAKHAVWNGCEVCHPEIYPHREGGVRSSMLEISTGESCGVCHGRVAFSLGNCERCHVKSVR